MNRSAAPAPVGRVLSDRYELVRHLARGGMADVYEATDRVLERAVAVKVFRAASPVDSVRFDTEVLVMAGLNHPCLVKVYDAGEQDGDGYLVLELVDGPDLRSILDERGRIPPHEVVSLGADLADALDHVHRAGVVHRDVNPSNILCDADGRPRLTDFGIARLLDTTHVTAVANTIGTAGYMAPEQVRGDDVGPPADVYALGLVLREALTGAPAFDGEPHEAAIARLVSDPDTSTGVPSEWRPLLADMTAREPGDRPTAATVHARLSPATAQRAVGASERVSGSTAGVAVVSADDDDAVEAPATTETIALGGLAPTETVPAAGGTAVMPAAQLASMTEPSPEPGSVPPASTEAKRQARRLLVGAAAFVAILFATVLMAEGRGGDAPTTTSSTVPVVTAAPTTAAPPPADEEKDEEKDDEKEDEKEDEKGGNGDEGGGNGTKGRDDGKGND